MELIIFLRFSEDESRKISMYHMYELEGFRIQTYTKLRKYWVVRKVRADVEGKLKRRKFKF